MTTRSTSFVRNLGNFQHLMDLQAFKQTFLVLVYSDACKPCQRLKPSLYKKVEEAGMVVYTIPRTLDDHVNMKLEVVKIPHVAVIKEGELRGGVQNSNIEITWSYVQECLAEFTLDEDF